MRDLFVLLSFICVFNTVIYAQTVTPWLTNGNQSALLEQQGSISFVGNSNPTSNSIIINKNVLSQSIEGYGFCLTQGSAEVINGLSNTKRDELLNELFGTNGLGISALRISIGASDLSNSVYSYNETQGDVNMNNFSLAGPDSTHLIPLLQEILLINPDIKILATPWTAPTWMKDNGTWIGGSLNPSYYAAYSLYFIKYLEALQGYGIDIWAITPQNEPENPFNEPSMLMSASEQTDFINNHLGPAIQLSTFNTKIIAFDHNCDNTAYPIQVLNNSSYVDGAAFHLYAGDISALSTVHDATGKNIYFTEQFTSSNGNFNGDFGWHMRNVIIGASNNWSKTVFEWNLASDSNHDPHTPGGCTDCLGALTIPDANNYTRNVSYYIIGQIAKFVFPGAQKIEAISTNNGISTTAFKNLDGTIVVIAYNNNNQTKTIRVIDGNDSFSYSLPKKSAVSFVWSTSNNPTAPIAPSALSASSLSSSSIELNWADNSNNEDFFEIQRSLNGTSNWQTTATPSSNVTSIVDNNLNPSTEYFYRIRATNSAGNSSWSNIANATTQSNSGGGGPAGIYNIIAQHSDKGLDVANQAGNNNANIHQWEIFNGGGDNQRWDILQNDDGTYQIKVIHSGKCLSVRSSNNNNVVQKKCDGSNGQKWDISSVEIDYYSLTNQLNGDALEVESAALNNGGNVQTGNYANGSHQKWKFEPVSGGGSSNFQSPTNLALLSNVKIFPNPTNQFLNIHLPTNWKDDIVSLMIVDLNGRVIFTKTLMFELSLSISVRDLTTGIYFVKIQNSKDEIISKSFEIKH